MWACLCQLSHTPQFAVARSAVSSYFSPHLCLSSAHGGVQCALGTIISQHRLFFCGVKDAQSLRGVWKSPVQSVAPEGRQLSVLQSLLQASVPLPTFPGGPAVS